MPALQRIKREAPVTSSITREGQTTRPQLRKKVLSSKHHQKNLAKVHKSASSGIKKEHKQKRWRPGTVALREIRKLQQKTDNLIAKAPFRRLVRECLMQAMVPKRLSEMGAMALQDSTEEYVVGLLADSNLCALHAKRVTIMPRDLHLARRLRGERM